MVRARWIVAAGVAAVLAVTGTGVTAAASSSPTARVETCVAGRADTLATARLCAPRGAVIARTGHGYLIDLVGAVAALPASPGCAYREKTGIDLAGLADWMGETMCWNGNAWWSGGAAFSCTPFLPGASCQGHRPFYAHLDPTRTGYYEAAVLGAFYQTCTWIFDCADYLLFEQFGNGSFSPYFGSLT